VLGDKTLKTVSASGFFHLTFSTVELIEMKLTRRGSDVVLKTIEKV